MKCNHCEGDMVKNPERFMVCTNCGVMGNQPEMRTTYQIESERSISSELGSFIGYQEGKMNKINEKAKRHILEKGKKETRTFNFHNKQLLIICSQFELTKQIRERAQYIFKMICRKRFELFENTKFIKFSPIVIFSILKATKENNHPITFVDIFNFVKEYEPKLSFDLWFKYRNAICYVFDMRV